MCNMCSRDVTPALDAPPPQETKRNGSLERMKKKHNITTDPLNEEKQKEVAYQPDLLSVSTQMTKVVYDYVKSGLVRLQETKAYVWVRFIFLQ